MSWEENSQFIIRSIEKLVDGQDKMQDELTKVSTGMMEYNGHLKDHMKRTELAEGVQSAHSERISELEKVEVEKQAIRRFKKAQRDKWLMWMGIVATIVGILVAIKELR